jgi:hypothetical protein
MVDSHFATKGEDMRSRVMPDHLGVEVYSLLKMIPGQGPGSVIILIKGDDAGAVGVGLGAGLHRVGRVETGAGALLLHFIPEVAPFPDAMSQAGDGADGGGVFSDFLFLLKINRQARSYVHQGGLRYHHIFFYFLLKILASYQQPGEF